MKSVYANVEGQRVIDGERVCEDVTKVEMPTIEHDTTTIEVAGMAMAVDMPNMARVKAMECSIAHNNGVNCKYLSTPGKHNMEFRVVRQKFDVATNSIGSESVKYRIQGFLKSTDKGSIEMGNPLGSTNKYSITRYEEEVGGELVTVLDAFAGILKINGQDYAGNVESLLS